MKKKIICFIIIGILLLTGFQSILAIESETKTENDDNNITISDDDTIEIQLTQDEIDEIYAWCESIEDIELRNQVRQALYDTITSNGVLYIQELKQKLTDVGKDAFIKAVKKYQPKEIGALVAVKEPGYTWHSDKHVFYMNPIHILEKVGILEKNDKK